MLAAQETVLVGYDGSDDAAMAIRRAGALLAPRRAVVAYVWGSLASLLLHTDVSRLGGTVFEAAHELDAEDRERAEARAAEGAGLAREAGFDATPVGAMGKPKAWPTLLELARRHDAAAIVVGSRGLGGVRSALLGSVSSGVLHHAQLPVLIVPPPEDEHAPGPVVIGYDGSDHARRAIAAAGRLLAVREAVVQNVWVSYAALAPAAAAGMPAPAVPDGVEQVDRGLAQGADRTAHEGVRLAAAEGLEARPHAARADGNVWRSLLDTAHDRRAAAVVVGSRGRSTMGAALLGSVSRALAHHAAVPLLVVPPAD
ncbi:MAG TPA: universal stress protein [Thermoleophilaceae bacterium]